MAKSTAVTPHRVPMAVAATDLAFLCDEIDSGVEPSTALVARFNETRLELADAIDRRIVFIGMVEGSIEQARAMRAGWDAKVQQLKALHDTMRAKTKEIIEAQPDLPYQGRLGKLAVQKNGGVTPVVTTWGDRELTAELVDMFGIDERYFYAETTYKLRPEVVLKDLEAGEELGWAQLGPRGTHLRIKLTPGGAP